MTEAADTRAGEKNLEWLLRRGVVFQVLHCAENARKSVVSLLGSLVGPVSYKVFQSLRSADPVGLSVAFLGVFDVLV